MVQVLGAISRRLLGAFGHVEREAVRYVLFNWLWQLRLSFARRVRAQARGHRWPSLPAHRRVRAFGAPFVLGAIFRRP
eukprot:3063547-Pyramimonas_sp.AAC.1